MKAKAYGWMVLLCLAAGAAHGQEGSALGRTVAAYPQDGTPQVGELAPDFTLESLDGAPISLSDFRGKVVLIDFFGFL